MKLWNSFNLEPNMASNNYQSHYSQTPPSPTFKTHPTRRRIIRKSPRNSIKLSTLKKSSTIPPRNDLIQDSSDSSPHLLRRNTFERHEFQRFDLNTLKTSPRNYPENNPPVFKQGSSKSQKYCHQESSYENPDFHCESAQPLKTTPNGIVSALSDPGGGSGTLLRLFSCARCGGVLRQPVTLECGHTCCKGCGVDRCPTCGVPVDRVQCVNVLVRSIVNKLVGERLQEKGNIFLINT